MLICIQKPSFVNIRQSSNTILPYLAASVVLTSQAWQIFLCIDETGETFFDKLFPSLQDSLHLAGWWLGSWVQFLTRNFHSIFVFLEFPVGLTDYLFNHRKAVFYCKIILLLLHGGDLLRKYFLPDLKWLFSWYVIISKIRSVQICCRFWYLCCLIDVVVFGVVL